MNVNTTTVAEVKNSTLAAQNNGSKAIDTFIYFDQQARAAREAQYESFIELLKNVYGISLNSVITIDGKPFLITDDSVRWTDNVELKIYELTKEFKVYQRGQSWTLTLDTLAMHKVLPIGKEWNDDRSQCSGQINEYNKRLFREAFAKME